MKNILEKIDNAKHIEIIVEKRHLFTASALYTYILTLHKKVSLVCKDKVIEQKYSFIPWFDKIKKTDTPSADLSIEFESNALELFSELKKLDIKINKKMATAIYGSLLDETEGFSNTKTDGIVFACVSELVSFGAEHRLCREFILERLSLSQLRLKSMMLESMLLENDAKAALFFLSDKELKMSGANIEDAKSIIEEALRLPYVETTILVDKDNKNETMKIVQKES